MGFGFVRKPVLMHMKNNWKNFQAAAENNFFLFLNRNLYIQVSFTIFVKLKNEKQYSFIHCLDSSSYWCSL